MNTASHDAPAPTVLWDLAKTYGFLVFNALIVSLL